MGKVIDITGQTFGRLTVLKQVPKPEHLKQRGAYWLCRCQCSNHTELIVWGTNLRTGNTKSCGCLQKESASETHLKDLTGQTFGHLTVLKRGKTQNQQTYWTCQCNCKNKTVIDIYHYNLTSHRTTSRGCLKQSIGASNIEKDLNDMGLSYFKESYAYFQDTRMFFDFSINGQYFIEFDDQQHFQWTGGWNNKTEWEKRREKDLLKNQYCFENDIPLIRIPYDADWTKEDLLLETTRFLITPSNEKQYYKDRGV